MKLLFWKQNKVIDDFAKVLADEFYSQVPPKLADQYFEGSIDAKNKKALNRELQSVKDNLTDASLALKDFKQKQSLGVYGKARLLMAFSNQLERLGYSKFAARKVNEFLVLSPL